VGVKDKVAGAAPDGGEVSQRARRVSSVAQQNPLGLAIGAVAVGFVAGMLIPSTRVEDEKLGEASDSVVEKVKETGSEALEHGKQVAQDAAQTAKESGQEHAQQVKETVQDSGSSSSGQPEYTTR
jgi:gas vesicle protein